MTKVLGRDKGVSMGEAEVGRNFDLRSRPGLVARVSRRVFDVATWALDCGKFWCRDPVLRSRPG